MNQTRRIAIVNSPKISFSDALQKPDLLNQKLTSDYTLALIGWQLENTSEPILILAVRTDHPTPDGPWAHSGGKAIDLYARDWQGREQEAVCAVMKGLALNPYCEAVGLGGVTQQWKTYVTWPTAYFVLFMDSAADHLHAGCANAVDPVGARLGKG